MRRGESGLAELHWDAAPTLPGGGTAAPALWTLTSTPGTPETLCAGPHGHAHPGPGGFSAAARLCLAWSPQVPESLLLLEGVGQPLLSPVLRLQGQPARHPDRIRSSRPSECQGQGRSGAFRTGKGRGVPQVPMESGELVQKLRNSDWARERP